jgi:hypothetical protein
MVIMKSFLLPALCALAALSLFTPDSQAQSPGGTGTGTGTGTTGGTGAGARRRGGAGLEQRAREIIAKYDKDGDHALNATELAAFFEAMHQRVQERRTQQTSNTTTPNAGGTQHAAGTPQEHAAKAIEKFDKNGDGKLEAGELEALLKFIREREMQHRGEGPGRTAPATTPPAAT